MVDVGAPPSDGIGGIPKRTLLIGAVAIGGAIGLFVFISRKTSAPSANAENKAQTTVPQNTLTLAYQNLAEQLLGFRGDVSVANANLAQGEQDILSQIGAESSARASANAGLSSGIQSVLSQLGNQSTSQSATNRNIMASIWQVFYRQSNPNATWEELVTKNPYFQSTTDPSSTSGTSASTSTSTATQTSTAGAGGATPRDAIMAAFGANDDDAHYYLAHMSAGPVRQLTHRSY